MISQPIKSSSLRLWEEYIFYVPDFNWLSNQATIVGIG